MVMVLKLLLVMMLVIVTFPMVREGVVSFNSQIVLPKTFLSKRFSVTISTSKRIVKDKVVFNPFEFKAFGFFQTWSSW